MLAASVASPVDLALARLDRWFETMRTEDGYGGPVAHWWRDCLTFCGPGLDWRYEGLIAGYLTLHDRTGQKCWLDKARRAADDLVGGQLPSGHYRNSCFEANPGVGGTPHEAAADIGLLLVAKTLRDRQLDGWTPYLEAASTSLQRCHVERLWSESDRRFWDHRTGPSFVPNKAATLIEALCLLSELTGRETYLGRYVRPTADLILELQVRQHGHPLDGAIVQSTLGSQLVEKYFPFYNARCVPGLIAAYRYLGDARYAEAALRVMAFLERWREPDGTFPQVIYGNGHVNRLPRWLAPLGDILRAADLLRPLGLHFPTEPSLGRLLAAQLPSGAFAGAEGFASQISQCPVDGLDDARDLLPIVGWNDKAFRFLAGHVTDALPEGEPVDDWSRDCRWYGRAATLQERPHELRVTDQSGMTLFHWLKSEPWARLTHPSTHRRALTLDSSR